MKKVFQDKFNSAEWQARIKAIIPFYGQKLDGNVAATEHVLAETSRILQLDYTPSSAANDETSDNHDAVIGK